MRIIELKLENIKTYVNETILFNDGINCILGLNGSGKTTIIESIGYSLFNYSNKVSTELLRYNESKGIISLSFEAKDGNIYTVIRTIRSKNASVKILDSSNHVLYENVSDVYEFIKKILGIPKEKSLSKIYEEIIAVPQGSFVNAFLDTPRNRKDNFDKLFELDIYKTLSDKTKIINDKIEKEHIVELEKENSLLEGQLINYDSVIEQTKEVINITEALKEKISINEDIYNKKIEKKELLERKQKLYISTAKDKEVLGKTIQANEEFLNQLKKQLEEAQKAKEVITKKEFGYNLYLKTAQNLQRNKENQEKYILIEKELKEQEITIKTNEEKIKVLNDSLHSLKLKLGNNKENIDAKKLLIETKTAEKADLEAKIGPLRVQINEAANLSTQMMAKKNLKLQLLKGAKEYIVLTYNQLKNKNIEAKIIEINSRLNEIHIKKEKIHKLEKEKINIDNTLNNLINNKKYMENGQCPILKQKCMNIKDSSLTIELEKMIQKEEEKLNSINKQINLLIYEISDEDKLQKEKEYFEFEKNAYLVDCEKYKSIINSIVENFKEENLTISEENDLEVIDDLINKYENEPINEDEDRLNHLREEISRVQFEKSAIEGLLLINNSAINTLEKENIDLMNNIQKQQEEINELQLKQVQLNKQVEEIRELLEKYLNIQKEIDDNEATLVKFQSEYEEYIMNIKEANLYENYQAKYQETEASNCIQKQQFDEANKFLNNDENKVDEKQIEDISTEILNISNLLSADKTTLTINEQNILKLSEEKDKLDILKAQQLQVQQQLNEYNHLLNKNKLFREIFTVLPRELSKQIRKYISILSTSIYRKISGENVRIDIIDDYEVILVDCVDEDKKKSIMQLSGGEQMSLAISIRLAMLKQITNIDFYFMDEPTINLDFERRTMVAEVVKDISNELNQLFVISHDDTFETITNSIIKLQKQGNTSIRVE